MLMMLQIPITILILIGMSAFIIILSARYWCPGTAQLHFKTTELSPEFREQFSPELAECTVPCKKLVEVTQATVVGIDDRPIIPAAGELLINEDRCRYLSEEVFKAGLEYEQAHITRRYYRRTFIVSLAISAMVLLGVHYGAVLLNAFLAAYRIAGITPFLNIVATLLNFFDTWMIAQIPVIFALTAWSECIVAHSIVKYVLYQGTSLEGLYEYLVYQESYVEPSVNETFNITSNRKYLETFLEKSE